MLKYRTFSFHKILFSSILIIVYLASHSFAREQYQADFGSLNKPEIAEFPLVALYERNNKEIYDLINRGVDPNVRDKQGNSLLHWAVELCNKELVEFLIRRKADVNAKTTGGGTPLHRASRCENDGILALLIKEGADVNAKIDNGTTPMHLLTRNSNYVKMLIEHGANINASDDHGYTPLHSAIKNRNKESINQLIANGAIVNAHCRRNYIENVGVIHESGSPLHFAVRYSHYSVEDPVKDTIELLLRKGAAIDSRNDSEQTPLHLALWRSMKETAELLITKGADPNARCKHGMSALHIASRNQLMQSVSLLIAKKQM